MNKWISFEELGVPHTAYNFKNRTHETVDILHFPHDRSKTKKEEVPEVFKFIETQQVTSSVIANPPDEAVTTKFAEVIPYLSVSHGR